MRIGRSRLWLVGLVLVAATILALVAVGCGGSTTTTTAAGPAATTGPTTAGSETTSTSASPADTSTQTPVMGTTVVAGTPWLDTTKFKKPPPWTIGVSMPSLSDEWLVYFLDLIKYWADKNKDLVKNLYVTEGQGNPVKQISDVKDLVTKGIDGLISIPVTPAANAGQNYAFEKGIPVVQVVRTGGTEEYSATLLTDEITIGTKITEWLAKALGGKGNIVVFSGVAGSWPSEGRLIGMKQVLANYPDIHIVGGPVYTAWAAAPAKKAMEDWVAAGLQIDGIWSDSGMMAKPAYEAWLAAGKKPIPAVGDAYNGWLKFWQQNKLGDTVHGVNNVPLYSGIDAMETIFKALRGEPIPRTSYFAVSEIDAATMAQLVRTDLSDAYFAQDTIPGAFTPPADLLTQIFGLKK